MNASQRLPLVLIRIASVVALLGAHVPVSALVISTKTTRLTVSNCNCSWGGSCALSATGSGEHASTADSNWSGPITPVRFRIPDAALPPTSSVLVEADIVVATARQSWIQPGSGLVTARIETYIGGTQPQEMFSQSLGEATPPVYSAECGLMQGPPPAPLPLVPFPGLEERMGGYLQRPDKWYTDLNPTNQNWLVLESVNADTVFEIEYIDLTLRYVAPAVIDFLNPFPGSAASTRRVLISKAGPESYPNAGQTADREVEIKVKVTRDLQPSPDETVYFLTVDPADEPPNTDDYYIPAAMRAADDNRDTTVGKGILAASQATTGADGIARVKLTITDRIAGDNYQVKASIDPYLLQNVRVNAVTSETLTAWKRVYVEVDRMAKGGTYLRSNVAPQATELMVVNADGFSSGEKVVLIHAPALGSGQKTFYSQEVIVKQVDKRNNILKLNVTDPLFRVTAPYQGPPAGSPHLADAVLRTSTGLFKADTSNLASTWNAAFTDVVYTTDDPAPYVPYEAEVAGGLGVGSASQEIVQIAQKWHYHDVDANHLHLIAGSRSNDSTKLGEASSRYFDTNMAWIFEQTVNNNAPAGAGEQRLNIEATVHEMTHLWQVVHCTQKEFNSTHFCTMSDGSLWKSCGGATCGDFFDGITRFHFVAPDDSEYLWIRKRWNPLPEYDIPNP